jgi:hypothetical protein
MTAPTNDTAKNAEGMRRHIRLTNALGFLCPVEWSRSLQATRRTQVLRERARGLILHDLTLCGDVKRLRIRLAAMQAKAILDGRDITDQK